MMGKDESQSGGLDRDVRELKGVGEKKRAALHRLGIFQVRDLLYHFPRRYEDRSQCFLIRAAPTDVPVCIRAMAAEPPRLQTVRRGLRLVKFRAVDDSGSVEITFFNQIYVKDRVRQGETYLFYGKLSGTPGRRTMTNPVLTSAPPEGVEYRGQILPRYPLSAGLSNGIMQTLVRTALQEADGCLRDCLPESIRREHGLVSTAVAFENIHFPQSFTALDQARRRLAFEELLILFCSLGQLRAGQERAAGILVQAVDPARFYGTLPFSPTDAQRRAILEILADLAAGRPMHRLLQGDVGSGKTMVAAACIWAVCTSGGQAAFLAPTEILAEQHLQTLRGFLSPFALRVEKLTGATPAREKREIKSALAAGTLPVVVGTHALLTGDVNFSALALAVTDEQHRFGVAQRAALAAKGTRPHVLVMSATPIPRTLALMIYGDLDVSVLDCLPPGRQKVDTFVVDERYRERLYGFVEKLANEGRQIFVVCPMVEEQEPEAEGDGSDGGTGGRSAPELKSAAAHAAALRERFPTLRIGCVHGKLLAREKEAQMAAMAAGTLQVLVSTTVIEVGVDVPNAALMIVENAERFGLSQLHQLRGRVGRGSHKSWCILVSNATGGDAQARLKALCQTNDGFRISEEDLRLRGPGDFFGERQHGLPNLHVATLGADLALVQSAQHAAKTLLLEDPNLEQPEHRLLAQQVHRMQNAET